MLSAARGAYPPPSHPISYLAWPAHREHASFLRHGGRDGGVAIVWNLVCVAAVGLAVISKGLFRRMFLWYA